ncbi:MAG: Fic family protein [Christensenellales bacterium]|jgi:fido (protein-threonine AMPylation protein)|nr:cell filamentation protein [Clostridiales bacterium]
MERDPFSEYLIHNEPNKKEKSYSWYTAIGLQDVDGLKTSDYLKDIAIKNITGEISFDEATRLINSYYERKPDKNFDTVEADKVSINIAKILLDDSFVFSPVQYLDIHQKIFSNVFAHAGQIRKYNIYKKEWVLDGDTVIYGDASFIEKALDYDFREERNFDYSNLSKDDFIKHIAKFISRLWQIHVFLEGNTRTTAVFLIKYLKTFGYTTTNTTFAENAYYFRNALVRANYKNFKNGIYETTLYLELFLRNLLFDENNELKSRHLHVNWEPSSKMNNQKISIINYPQLSTTIRNHTFNLYENLKTKAYFGRSDVVKILELSVSGASKLIAKLLAFEIILPVTGHGKGKYNFNVDKFIFE